MDTGTGTASVPDLTVSEGEDTIRISVRGSWTAERLGVLEDEIAGLQMRGGSRDLEIDLSGVQAFDTYGVWLLEKLRRQHESTGSSVRFSGIADSAKPLFDEMTAVNRAAPSPMADGSALDRLAGHLTELLRDIADFSKMLGATAIALAGALASPGKFRFTTTIHQFDRVGWRALPIVLLVTLIIGAIIAQQGFFHFSNFGADLYVVDMIGFLIMREIGVLLVAIMVAGRSGSAFTAELGSMRMREEVDALRTMGLDPVAVLALPRTLALVIALPILTFVGSMAALFGAGLVAVYYAGLSPDLFIDRLREAISLDHLRVGLIKAPFIGLVIGTIACAEGFRVAGSTTSLGYHTTQSVVKSIFMVIVLDGLFALFFSGIGM